VAPPEDASAANTGATCTVRVPESAAAMAKLSFEYEPCGLGAAPRHRRLAADRVAFLRIASSPFFSKTLGMQAHAYSGSCLAKATPVND
jgi:hypothetical protein